MSLNVWLKKSRKCVVGGKELYMVPLPLRRLYGIGTWLEENADSVIKDVVSESAGNPGQIPSPMVLVARVLTRVDVAELAYSVFAFPKDPDTGEPLNKGITKEFFDEYLDLTSARDLVKTFVELNEVEDLIKNLQSLPVIKKLMEASSLSFGIRFLSSLQSSTDSTQTTSEGSLSHKSTDSATPTTEGNSEAQPQTKANQRVM